MSTTRPQTTEDTALLPIVVIIIIWLKLQTWLQKYTFNQANLVFKKQNKKKLAINPTKPFQAFRFKSLTPVKNSKDEITKINNQLFFQN